MNEKLTEDRIEIGARFCKGLINERQAIFLLVTSGLSQEEANIFLETMEYGVFVTSRVIIKLSYTLMLGFIAVLSIGSLLLLLFK